MMERLGPRPKAVTLLGAQALAHGVLTILTIVPAAGLFLSSYGAKRLPYVYIAVAFVGTATAPLLARALGRWSIATVARPIFLTFAAIHLLCWVAIERWGARWPAIVVQMLLPITLQLGFVFLGSQAGQLLTMREMKAWFSIVAAGFSVALLAGGLIAPMLVDVLGATHHLLLLTATSAVMLATLTTITHRRYRDRLSISHADQHSVERDPPKSAGAPVRRLIGLIFAYQVLSSLGTQFGEFFLFDRAAARYATSEQLARFASHYNVALNVVELVFLSLVAGPLLRRFGLRFGLSANPVVLLAGFAAAAIVGPVAGVGSFAMLLAAAASRTGDITLTNSTTRTATNTAFQALPFAVRPAVQARTEGVAVPAAIGLSGIMLLIIEWVGGDVQVMIGVSIVVCLLWLIITNALFAQYRTQLHDNLAYRTMSPSSVAAGAEPDHFQARLTAPAVAGPGASPKAWRDIARSIRHAEADSVDYLIALTETAPCAIATQAERRLSSLLHADDRRRASLASFGIQTALRHAGDVQSALRAIPVTDYSLPVHQALLDEARACQHHVLASLSMVLNPDAIARAALWLDGSDHERSTALESIEVNAPREHRAAILAVLSLGQADNPNEADRLLRQAGANPAVVTDWLVDLRDDPRRVWNDRWLAMCAEHMLGRTQVLVISSTGPELASRKSSP